ncbi:MAG TPA: response regulator transcription factor [Streptosporangiaceae bacterium]|nr:response regulator transcription factor [Streptosporangiaceae bacterium]
MNAARILVVDDELSLRRLMRLYLGQAGFAVQEASTGAQALAALRRGDIDLAIVDVMLPEVDGFEVVRQARRNSSIPIILLTARGEEASRVAGLEIGADDYVVKPFLAHEVVARVRAQLRRARGFGADAAALRVGVVELDRRARRCAVRGEGIELTRREFDLLETLLASPGRAYTRDQLLDEVWGSRFVSEKTIDVHIVGLRRKLGGALRISTLRGVGYRLEADA